MTLEVERKFRIEDAKSLQQTIVAWGGNWSEPKTQIDQYFSHPTRDFAATDEALRIRSSQQRCSITYKGPKLDRTTKTRREIELAFDQRVKDPEEATELLLALGFGPVAKVVKQRQSATLNRAGQAISVDLDRVDRLGWFVELEIVCDQQHLQAATAALNVLASELTLHEDIRDSYLELLLKEDRPAS